jgi:hypothetical protein
MFEPLAANSRELTRDRLCRFSIQTALFAALLCYALGANLAEAGGFDIHGFGTYAVLLEVNSSDSKGRLGEPTSRRIASANWSMDLNRTTAAFGTVGPLGPCDVASAQETHRAQADAGIWAAVSHHAYVAPSYAHLPVSLQRDFVRGSFVGLASAVNQMLSDTAVSADAKSLALGQYLHFAQDIFFHQDEKSGKPFEVGSGKLRREPDQVQPADRATTSDAAISDAALKAYAFTYQAAKTFNQTGSLPQVPPPEKFDSSFYGPLSASERTEIVKTLQAAGIYKYLEAIAHSYRPSNSAKRTDEAAGKVDTVNRIPEPSVRQNGLKAGLTEIWRAAHPEGSVFQLPEIDDRGYRDFVNYDLHPEWLVPEQLRSEEADARRPIDDLALAQQASNLLRAKIEQSELILRNDGSQQRDRIRITLQALKRYSNDGEDALKQFGTAKDPTEKRRSIQVALSNFQQGLRQAGQMEMDLNAEPTRSRPNSAAERGARKGNASSLIPLQEPSPSQQAGAPPPSATTVETPSTQQSAPAASRGSCFEEPSAAVEAFEQEIDEVVAVAVAGAFDAVGAQLSVDDQTICVAASFAAVRSVLKGGTVQVPEKCRRMANAGRAELAYYARAHIKTLNPGVEELLSNLNARDPNSGGPNGGAK